MYQEKREFSYDITINSIALVSAENYCGLGQQKRDLGATAVKNRLH